MRSPVNNVLKSTFLSFISNFNTRFSSLFSQSFNPDTSTNLLVISLHWYLEIIDLKWQFSIFYSAELKSWWQTSWSVWLFSKLGSRTRAWTHWVSQEVTLAAGEGVPPWQSDKITNPPEHFECLVLWYHFELFAVGFSGIKTWTLPYV